MNNFNAKYIRISSAYLTEKMNILHIQDKEHKVDSSKKESTLHKFVTKFFRTKEV